MMLIEQTSVPAGVLPVAELKAHLRLGTGFSDDGMQDGLIESHLRAAMAAIEGRVGKVLIARRFLLRLDDWRDGAAQALPVAPVTGVLSVTLVDAQGASVLVPAGRYRLVEDMHRPKLAAAGAMLPLVPSEGRVDVVFDAGFGATWAQVPADLRQAVLMLGAEYYEHRHDGGGQSGGLPQAVLVLIERWRTVRVLGGGAA